MGAGKRRARLTKGAALERPLTKAFAAIPGNKIEGNMNFRTTEAKPESNTLTHQGYSSFRICLSLSMEKPST
jgi:hypothetical protein